MRIEEEVKKLMKIRECIQSCTQLEQLESCNNMLYNFLNTMPEVQLLKHFYGQVSSYYDIRKENFILDKEAHLSKDDIVERMHNEYIEQATEAGVPLWMHQWYEVPTMNPNLSAS